MCDRTHVKFGDFELSQQSELESLRYYDVLEGSLTLTNDVQDISPLACRSQITGELRLFDTTRLVHLRGLERLQSVGGTLSFSGKAALTDVEGLSNLIHVGGGVTVEENPVLQSLKGFDSLAANSWNVFDKGMLSNLEGLGAVESAAVRIAYNRDLASLTGLGNL